ncbi:MAG: recombinase family protein [Alphaproteobacteria bacterium]|nr:recombinase family protein [Alphaproteobacteria bacterium]
MPPNKGPHARCAIYTRKSSEEGLEQDFNSLHAQREACEAFIRSQKAEGWRLVETAYDDGGFSGGTMERPALLRLLDDIRAKRVDIVVVYKIDRLTRSLSDFARMVEVFDASGISFVAVTQQFNTTTSMGRLTLNILLSFAQFEREVTGERIRDKIAASKRKGMWMGGHPSLGYDIADRKLIVNPAEAATVRHIFQRYLDLGCVRHLCDDLECGGVRSKQRVSDSGRRFGGGPLGRGALYTLLRNPIYIGEICHKGLRHPGQHEAIIDRELWGAVQQRLAGNITERQSRSGRIEASVLVGRIYEDSGERMTPSHAIKNGRRYRYYVSRSLVTGTVETSGRGWRLPARELERCVADSAIAILRKRPALAAALREAGLPTDQVPTALVVAAQCIERLKSDAEVAALTDLINRVEVSEDGLLLVLSLVPLLPTDTVVDHPEALLLSQRIPMQVRRRGVELRLAIETDSGIPHKADPALLKAVTRARGWLADLVNGTAPNIVALAAREGVTDRYIGHLLPLAFLAPSIVDAIVNGRQPVDVTAEALVKRIDLPLDWPEQQRVLGFV